MKRLRLSWTLVTLAAALAVGAGCGGNDGGGSTPQAVSQGVITGFGSVFVNGIEFDCSGASITMDDQPAVQGSLSLGMVVTIEGHWDPTLGTGTASNVIYKDDLQGFIDTLDTLAGTLTVFGQTVRVDQNTIFEHTSGLAGIDPLAAGDLVEVSGYPDGSGALRATHVERKGAGEDVEIKGTVISAPAGSSFTFRTPINPAVDYTVLFTPPLPAGVGSGSFVEIKVEDFVLGTLTITASEVQLEDEPSFDENAKVEIEGYISSFVSNGDFQVNGIPVDASGVTGLTGLMDGLRVEVEGTYSGGTLVAHEVSFQGTGEGVISGFGSVIINGIEYDVAGAVITVDGVSATESSLSSGMVVQVRGKSDPVTGTGTAVEILYADDLQGPIETLDPVAGTLIVMGMAVLTDNTTIFEHVAGLSALAAGDLVEVSGFTDPSGALLAAYVEKKGALDELEIKGTVINMDGPGKVFELFLTDSSPLYSVDASALASTLLSEFAEGDYVEVKASSFDSGTMTLVAEELHLEDSLEPCDGEHAEVEGIISNYDAPTQTFLVETTPVDASVLDPAGLMDGMEVEVEGPIVDGILMATEINLEQENTLEVEGDLEAVDTLQGTVTVMGTVFQTSVSTILKDKSAAGLASLTLADLAVGDHLVVAGWPDGASNQAALVERTDAAVQAMMQGPVSAYSDTAPFSVTLLGREIPLTGTSFNDATGSPLDAASFFAAIATPTTVVSVSWDDFVDFATPPNEAELESP